MTTATELRPTRLLEESYYTGQGQVDPENHVIRDVKLVGKQSKWGYTYTDEALQGAVPLYEGVPVYENHAEKADKGRGERRVEDKVGWIENVRWKADGNYGDFHFLESHPHTPMFLEWATRNPKGIGFSQVAFGKKKGKRGALQYVESINEVLSVDLVASPATTGGMFESYSEDIPKMKTTLKELVESFGSDSEKKNLTLLEESVLGVQVELDEPEDGDKGVVSRGIQAAVTDLFAEGGDITEPVNRLLNAQQILRTGKPAEFPADPPKDQSELVESLREELNAMKAEKQALELLQEHSVDSSRIRIKQLIRCDSKSEQMELVEEWKSDGRPDRSGRQEQDDDVDTALAAFKSHRPSK